MYSDYANNIRKKDSRSQLLTRESFYADVAPLVEAADANGGTLILLDIDVDGLDFILRTFGPQQRDALVSEIGDRIRDAVGSGDALLYHITQDRFAVVLQDRSYVDATRISRMLVDALRAPFDVDGISYRMTAHVGISHYPNHASTISEFVRTGVFACHQARTAGGEYATFDRQLDELERQRFRLMVDLKRALENGNEIRMAYQPIIDLASGECIGAEALCRWEHPEHGMVPPGHFLPFVEQTPLMMPLTEVTLALGLKDLAAWRKQGFNGKLGINLSPTLFRLPDLLDRLIEQFRFSNVGMEVMHFEVTETGIMDQPKQAVNTLNAIRERQGKVSVDDFGTGHSSLAYLADLPVDTIKIDRYFVQNLAKPWGEAIVGATATLAQKLGLTTVAEGIEHESELDKCRELGIDTAQGFYIAKPMFREAFEAWLQ
jgi:predicted signal transduction protein with EAL and GGDEF domain